MLYGERMLIRGRSTSHTDNFRPNITLYCLESTAVLMKFNLMASVFFFITAYNEIKSKCEVLNFFCSLVEQAVLAVCVEMAKLSITQKKTH